MEDLYTQDVSCLTLLRGIDCGFNYICIVQNTTLYGIYICVYVYVYSIYIYIDNIDYAILCLYAYRPMNVEHACENGFWSILPNLLLD